MRYVLDTNIAVAALNAHQMVASRLAVLPRDEVGLPLLVLAELLFGKPERDDGARYFYGRNGPAE